MGSMGGMGEMGGMIYRNFSKSIILPIPPIIPIPPKNSHQGRHPCPPSLSTFHCPLSTNLILNPNLPLIAVRLQLRRVHGACHCWQCTELAGDFSSYSVAHAVFASR